ncbi:diguanylate cyclase domain-containing protein [Mangrovitalea sediminis]|uniref:diguanylate cyclase domain-containing protein n=1 Tax=Mangrovitalea sediminis TaxID=1982043 RepID=UPI00130412AA|nr:diguanylate cyclase [Mangrovitalea sediminis]
MLIDKSLSLEFGMPGNAAFDACEALVVILDQNGDILVFNRAAQQLTGYSVDEVRATRFFWEEFLEAEDAAAIKALLDQLSTSPGLRHHFDAQCATRSGEQRFLAWKSSRVESKDKAKHYLLLEGFDITGRKRLEADLSSRTDYLERLTQLNLLIAEINLFAAQAENEAELLRDICHLLMRYSMLELVLIGEQRDSGIQVVSYKAKPDLPADWSVSSVPGRELIRRSFREGRAFFNAPVIDAAESVSSRLQLLSTIPIRRRGKVWVTLCLYSSHAGPFDNGLEAMLEKLALDIGRGIDNLALKSWRKALLDNSVVGVILVKDRIILEANARVTELLGLKPGELNGKSTRTLYLHESEYDRVGKAYERLATEGSVRIDSMHLGRADGSLLIADLSGTQIKDIGTGLSVWTIEDVTTRETSQHLYHALAQAADVMLKTSDELTLLEKTCQQLVRDTPFQSVWLSRVDAESRIDIIASAREDGFCSADGRVSPEWRSVLISQTRACWESKKLEVKTTRTSGADAAKKDPDWRTVLAAPVQRGGQIWAVMTFTSSQSDAFEEKNIALCSRVADMLEHSLSALDTRKHLHFLQQQESLRARTDVLTGLPNRLAVEEYLPQSIARARRRGCSIAVGVLDLDDFKPVNDLYGHDAGDELLKTIALRLKSYMRETDFIGRIGGDEFILVLEDVDSNALEAHIDNALRRLHLSVESPINLAPGRDAEVGMTMGLSVFPSDAEDPANLMRMADAAMYQVKQEKTSRSRWWRMAGEGHLRPEVPSQEKHFDVYGSDARKLLTGARRLFDQVGPLFRERFYEELAKNDRAAAILETLSPSEMESLKNQQVKHIGTVLDPETTQAAILARARVLGEIHELCGVDSFLLSEAYGIYRRLIIKSLSESMLTAKDRYLMLLISDVRLQDDITTQLYVTKQVQQHYYSVLETKDDATPLLERLAALPGIRFSLLLQRDESGSFICCDSQGVAGQNILSTSNPQHPFRLDELLSRLGETAEGERSLHPDVQVYESQLERSNIVSLRKFNGLGQTRSLLMIPFGDSTQQTTGMVLLGGAYPNQFETLQMKSFSREIQRYIDCSR